MRQLALALPSKMARTSRVVAVSAAEIGNFDSQMIQKLFISLLTIVCMGLTGLAQTSVEISAPRQAYAGEPFSVTVTVTNPDGRVADIKAPSLDGCTFQGGPGVSTSSYTSIINGRMQSSKSTAYSFQYRADREGSVKVPQVEVNVNGKTYTTEPKSFTVMPSRGSQSPSGSAQGSQRRDNRPSSDFQIGANDLFMRIALSDNNVYEQQAVECSIKVYSSNGQINSLVASSIPTFDGCLIENLPTPTSIEWHSETVNGRSYYCATVYRALLYPQRSGEIKLNGGEYTIRVYRQTLVQDFFFARPEMQEKDVTVKPQSATLRVKALPEPRPDNFSGAVGRFAASGRLVGSKFRTNEASSVIYSIEGTGNIKFITEPDIDFPSEFEVYDPHVDSNTRVSGHNMTGTMNVEYTFVPQSVGKFNIGALDFVYFDPTDGQYKTSRVDGFDIDVEKGADVSHSAVGGKTDIQAKNTDIHHIKPGADRPGSNHTYMTQTTLYWLLYPLLLVVASLLLYVWIKKSNVDLKERRLNRAGKVARKRLAAAGKMLREKHYDTFYDELLRAMQTYLADKLMIPVSQLSRDNIRGELEQRGASADLLRDLIGIIDDCEMARYTPNLTPENADRLYDAARRVIDSIENLK